MSALVFVLAERGELHLDDPVARYWPEFGLNGKGKITIREALQHRSRMPVVGNTLSDALCMRNWNKSVRQIERARPLRLTSRGPAYHFLSFGFILGELIQSVTGFEVRKFLASEMLRPLGMGDTFLGLPQEEWERQVPLRISRIGGRVVQIALNAKKTRSAVIPAGGISTSARDLAIFYQVLVQNGEFNGFRLLQPASVRLAVTPSNSGEWDHYATAPIRWANGFQHGGPRSDPRFVSPMGRSSTANVRSQWEQLLHRLG